MKSIILLLVACLAFTAWARPEKPANETRTQRVQYTSWGECNGINFPSVNGGSSSDLTCFMESAELTPGHTLVCSTPHLPTTGLFTATITAYQEVTIRYINTGGSAVDNPSLDFMCATYCPNC